VQSMYMKTWQELHLSFNTSLVLLIISTRVALPGMMEMMPLTQMEMVIISQ
jgi:hypothetical protein